MRFSAVPLGISAKRLSVMTNILFGKTIIFGASQRNRSIISLLNEYTFQCVQYHYHIVVYTFGIQDRYIRTAI